MVIIYTYIILVMDKVYVLGKMKKLKIWIRVIFIRLPKEIRRYLTDLYNVEQFKI